MMPNTNDHMQPQQCQCKPPSMICNGKCVPRGACPTHKPQNGQQGGDRRRWLGSGSCAEKGFGWVACGVYGGSARSWECVNTQRDLESCEFFFAPFCLMSWEVGKWGGGGGYWRVPGGDGNAPSLCRRDAHIHGNITSTVERKRKLIKKRPMIAQVVVV
jgi:hypothetical protein